MKKIIETNKFLSRINWEMVEKEINRRLKGRYSKHYIQHVYRGAFKSAPVKDILDEILPPYEKMKKAA